MRSLALGAAASLLAGSAAHAAPPSAPLVQLSSCEKGCDALAARLRGELEGLGVTVQIHAGPEGASESKRAAPEAVVRLSAEPLSVHLWTRASMRMRTYSVDPTDTSGDVDVLARRVAEVVRAEISLPQSPTSIEPNDEPRRVPPPGLRPSPQGGRPPRAPFFIARVGPALTASSGPVSVLADVDLSAVILPIPWLRLAAFATLPIAPGSFDEGDAHVSLTTGFVGASAGIELGDPLGFSGALALGEAWQWIRAEGSGPAPLAGASATADVSFTFVEADAAYAVHPSLSLFASARGGFSAPRPVLAVGGEAVGGFGRPAFILTLGVAFPISLGAAPPTRTGEPREQPPGTEGETRAAPPETRRSDKETSR